jgi:hypothetical protein
MYSGIMRLSLWATNRAKKGQTDPGSALLYSHLDGARVARQHCSTLRLGNTILSLPCPAWIGHFYFGENRTFLLWLDSMSSIGKLCNHYLVV